MILGKSRPSAETTIAFLTPQRARLPTSDLTRASLKSLATSVPVLPMSAARCVVLPPGDAAMSSTRLPGSGASAMTGRKEEADCTMYCPARYSGVAPMGTALS